MQQLVVSQKNVRDKRKRYIAELCEKNPDLNCAIVKKFARGVVGRPSIEVEQPELQTTILDLVSAQCAADGRRRTEGLTFCSTLDELHQALKDKGFSLSRTRTYYRLLPARSNAIDATNHINTVPVRLKKPENNQRKKHSDSHFATGTIKMIKELAVLFGKDCCFYLSQDDKARVPIGIQAVNKQSAMLMHLEYKVRLPDHNWVVAERHKLIPSVYACCEITDHKVTYSGPTYVAVRSGKHDSSTAQTHSTDFDHLVSLEEFAPFAKTTDGLLKPILVVNVDGGPDENPRFPKTRNAWSSHFKEYNLDAIFVAAHAPGLSAFNAVERRMAPLSHALTGILLPHDFYGSHLDASGKTTDSELEKKNFAKAGQTLAEIFSKKEINSFPVLSNFIEAVPSTEEKLQSEDWLYVHVRQSQYLLQIVRCNNRNCCGPWRTNYDTIFPDRFIPSPILCTKTPRGIEPATIENVSGGRFGGLFMQLSVRKFEGQLLPEYRLPFDFYCPSVHGKIKSQICKQCKTYFPTQAAMKRHLQSKVCTRISIELGEFPSENVQFLEGTEELDDLPQTVQLQEGITNLPQNMGLFNERGGGGG